jgi:hypothetical protein
MSMSNMYCVLLGAGACLFGGGCVDSVPPEPMERPVFGEHVFSKVERPSKVIGQSCTAGANDCFSGLCIHYQSSDPANGFICSQTCERAKNCPSGFRCVRTHPGPDGSYCLPVSNASDAGQ